jgi:hypothetical protein
MGCEDFRDRMLDVLYGEADPDAARAFESHRRRCAACDDELRALRHLRRDLGAWAVPARPAPAVAAARSARTWLPLAAGIVLGIAGALALVGSQERVDTVAAALRVQDQRHRAEIDALKASLAAGRPRGEATFEDVRRLIRESEARQAVLVDAGLRDLAERTDAQRRQDLAQISAGLSYVEGRAGLQVARTTELMGHVLQAAQQK